MNYYLIICCFLINISCFSQSSFFETDAKRVISTFFDGFHKGDTVLMKTVMVRNMSMQSAFVSKDGKNRVNNSEASNFLLSLTKKPADQKWEERLLGVNGYKDGNLAVVWTPYEFYVNGKLSHCGANSFTLVNTNDGWKILNIIDSRRREGCQQPNKQ